jgi:hypothetical protein
VASDGWVWTADWPPLRVKVSGAIQRQVSQSGGSRVGEGMGRGVWQG